MKKAVTVLRIDKGPLNAKHRRELREALLQEMNVDQDEHKLDLLVEEYFERATIAGRQAADATGTRNRKLTHDMFLGAALALFLLASAPKSRASKLMTRLYSQGVNRHERTGLLALILKALGPYKRDDRRTVHRDSIVLHYLIRRDVLPSAVPSYLGKRGQGVVTTYGAAQALFDPDRAKKCELTIEPNAEKIFARQKDNHDTIAHIVNSPSGLVMKYCLIEPTKVRAVINFMRSLATKS